MKIAGKKKVLIIGGNGLIGRNLYASLKQMNWDVLFTSKRRMELDKNDQVFLDLINFDKNELPKDREVVFLCASENRMRACREDPALTQVINVEAQLKIANYYLEKNAQVVFLSSSAVFDGSQAFYKPQDKHCPNSIYGQQKSQVERSLSLSEKTTIFRITKLDMSLFPLINNWFSHLEKNETITPFADLYFAPITLHSVIEALIQTAAHQYTGILQLSSQYDMSYYDLALKLIRYLAKEPSLLIKGSAREQGIPKEEIFPHTTLEMTKEREYFGLMLQDPEQVMNNLIKMIHKIRIAARNVS